MTIALNLNPAASRAAVPAENRREAAVARARQRAIWNAVAASRGGSTSSDNAVTLRLITDACIESGARVLDVACGAGDPAEALAYAVGASGSVLALDLAPAMIEVARSRSRLHGRCNIEYGIIDDETSDIAFIAEFDAVTCRFGLMFMPEPLRALLSWRHALRRNGRVSICTHAALPPFSTTMEIVEDFAPMIAESLGWRDVLSLSSQREVRRLLESAGFTDVSVECVDQPHATGTNVAECWDNMIRKSPLSDKLGTIPADLSSAIRNACIRALSNDGASIDALPRIFGGSVLFASGARG